MSGFATSLPGSERSLPTTGNRDRTGPRSTVKSRRSPGLASILRSCPEAVPCWPALRPAILRTHARLFLGSSGCAPRTQRQNLFPWALLFLENGAPGPPPHVLSFSGTRFHHRRQRRPRINRKQKMSGTLAAIAQQFVSIANQFEFHRVAIRRKLFYLADVGGTDLVIPGICADSQQSPGVRRRFRLTHILVHTLEQISLLW